MKIGDRYKNGEKGVTTVEIIAVGPNHVGYKHLDGKWLYIYSIEEFTKVYTTLVKPKKTVYWIIYTYHTSQPLVYSSLNPNDLKQFTTYSNVFPIIARGQFDVEEGEGL
jgi:hypothetical protein